jgi:hypothetical protein
MTISAAGMCPINYVKIFGKSILFSNFAEVY